MATDLKQTVPGGANCDHFTAVINKGLLMVKADLIQFAGEIAESCGATVDPEVIAALERRKVALSPSWDFFEIGLTSARELTAHARFLNWHRANFKHKKRTLSHDNSNDGNEAKRSSKHVLRPPLAQGQ